MSESVLTVEKKDQIAFLTLNLAKLSDFTPRAVRICYFT